MSRASRARGTESPQRHDCFRSAFTGFERDQILQVVLDSVELSWTELDWRDKNERELPAAFEAHARAERRAGFEFAAAPLMRFTLIRERDARYRFLWTHHHSLLDGWSLGSVLAEVIGYYSELPACIRHEQLQDLSSMAAEPGPRASPGVLDEGTAVGRTPGTAEPAASRRRARPTSARG